MKKLFSQISKARLFNKWRLLGFWIILQLPGFSCPEGSGLRCPEGGETGIGAINEFIGLIIGWLLGIAFAVTVLFLIIGGFLYITSGGNEEQAERARGTIVNALIGIVLIILSYVIINAVVNLLSDNQPATP
jgi:hypothetical protein